MPCRLMAFKGRFIFISIMVFYKFSNLKINILKIGSSISMATLMFLAVSVSFILCLHQYESFNLEKTNPNISLQQFLHES